MLIRSYFKDSKDFIWKINNLKRNSKNSILVTMETHSLYTKFPNNEGIKAVEAT